MSWRKKISTILSTPPLTEEPMSLHTSLRIGGPAEFFVSPRDANELQGLLQLANENSVPVFVLGQGTNLLVKDGGIRGIVLSLEAMCSGCVFFNHSVRAGAAIPLPRLAREAANRGLKGLENFTGIPGSFGGALYMNAGAYGSSIGELVHEVTAMDFKGRQVVLSRSEIKFSYRWSIFQSEKLVILDGLLELMQGEKEMILQQARVIQEERRAKHPLLPSAGSVFRNPPIKPAGKLIEEAGGKGLVVGGAEVSLQHGNFIVNKGNATAGDVLRLIELVQQKVRETHGLELELEIKVIGENGSE